MRATIKRLLLFMFFIPSTVAGQTTQVTGTVIDSNGVPYAGASMKAGLVFAGTPVSNPTVTISTLSQCKANGFGSAPCNVPFSPTNGPFNLDSQGNIPGGGITLQDNTLVTPSGTQWAFTVNTAGSPPPLGTGPQTCSSTLTISGSSQSISASFASCPALGHSSGGGGGLPAGGSVGQAVVNTAPGAGSWQNYLYANLANFPAACGVNLFATQIAANPGCTQVAFSALSGAIATAQLGGTVGGDLSGTLPNPTVAKINGTAFSGTNGDVVAFGASNTPADSGIAAANVPTQAANAAAANQILQSGGANKTLVANDFPETHRFAAANQVSGTAGSGFSLGTCTVAARSGTNVVGGVVVCASSQTFQVQDVIPLDWDSGSLPFFRLFVTQGANVTSGQTITFQVQGACGTTDDTAFNTAQNLSSATTTTTAQQQFQETVQANSTTMTSCAAGSVINLKFTASAVPAGGSPNVQFLSVTWPRRPVVQAN